MSSTSQANWFETFFEGIAVELWSEFAKSIPSGLEVDYVEKTLNVRRGSVILDVPCGTGRHSIELARRGYQVVGIDISRDSIASARDAARLAGVRVEFREADMRAIPGVYDGAFCWGNSFGYLPHAETKRFLSVLARALKPKSAFILQIGAVAETLLPEYQKEETYQVGPIEFQIYNTYHVDTSILETEYRFTKDGKTEVRKGWQSIYTSGEICRMMSDASLEVERLDQSIEGAPYELGARQLILVARRRAQVLGGAGR